MLAELVGGTARGDILDGITAGEGAAGVLHRLRDALRSHRFPAGSREVNLRRLVDSLDARTRKDGLHVLQAWDFRAHHFSRDIAPVLLLDHCARIGVADERGRAAAAILLDNYLVALVSLLVVRAWDDGDPDANFGRLDELLAAVQGPNGSGHRFADHPETLLVLAVSYFHPEESAYDLLLTRARELNEARQLRFAAASAATLGSHLRWGLQFMYRKDVGMMRDDNVADYPWLLYAVQTLVRGWERAAESGDAMPRRRVVEALLDGLSPDPWAFTGPAPRCLASHGAEHGAVVELLARNRDALRGAFQEHQPSPRRYSPLGLGCNFLSNAAVAGVIVAATEGGKVETLDALFSSDPPRPGIESAEPFALRLAEYSAQPDRLGAHGTPLIVYNPFAAAHFHNTVMRTLG